MYIRTSQSISSTETQIYQSRQSHRAKIMPRAHRCNQLKRNNHNILIKQQQSHNDQFRRTHAHHCNHIYRWRSWMSRQRDQSTLPQILALATHIINDSQQHPNCANHDKQLPFTSTSLLNLATTIKSIATFVISRTNNKLVAPRMSKRQINHNIYQ